MSEIYGGENYLINLSTEPDLSSNLNLAISRNNLKGIYNATQHGEVVTEQMLINNLPTLKVEVIEYLYYQNLLDDISLPTLLVESAKIGRQVLFEYLQTITMYPERYYDIALYWAAFYNQPDMVEYIISQGGDPKYDNSGALQWAARKGHYQVVKLLLEHGANPKADNSNAIKWANQNKQYKIVQLLKSYMK